MCLISELPSLSLMEPARIITHLMRQNIWSTPSSSHLCRHRTVAVTRPGVICHISCEMYSKQGSINIKCTVSRVLLGYIWPPHSTPVHLTFISPVPVFIHHSPLWSPQSCVCKQAVTPVLAWPAQARWGFVFSLKSREFRRGISLHFAIMSTISPGPRARLIMERKQ